MRPRTVLIAVCFFGVLAGTGSLAGCGGSSGGPSGGPAPSASSTAGALSAAEYRQALQAVSQQADESQGLVQKILNAKSVAAVKTGLAAYAQGHQALTAAVSQLHPPADGVAANEQLAKAFADTSAAIRSLLPKVAEAKSAKAALALIQRAKAPQKAGQEIDAALQRLRALGYVGS
jgi:hypothetical protein